MSKFAIRLLTLAIFAMTLLAMPVLSAYAGGGDNPAPPPPTDTQKQKTKGHKSSSIEGS
jgi:hypothetical protein